MSASVERCLIALQAIWMAGRWEEGNFVDFNRKIMKINSNLVQNEVGSTHFQLCLAQVCVVLTLGTIEDGGKKLALRKELSPAHTQ